MHNLHTLQVSKLTLERFLVQFLKQIGASGSIYHLQALRLLCLSRLFELKHKRFVLHLGLGSILSASEAHSRHGAAVQSLKIPIYNNFGNPICNLICETKYSIILLRHKISLPVDITLAE